MKYHSPKYRPLTVLARACRLAAAGLLVVAALLGSTGVAEAQSVAVLHAVLQSGQEVPPTGSVSFGNAFVTFDIPTSMLCYSISYTDLEATETAAHFHGPALPGEGAGVLHTISEVGSPKVGCVGPLSNEERGWLAAGLFYINIHSMDDPGGEIRGQVLVSGLVTAP